MASVSRLWALTDRDMESLAGLDRCPLTAEQFLKLSQTFRQPFTNERRVRERLQVLYDSGRVRRLQYYASAGRGAQNYYRLTRVGYRLLHGDDAVPPSKRYFAEIGAANHHHTRCLADFIVHTVVTSHRATMPLRHFVRENALRLPIGDEHLYPDCAFQIVTPDGRSFSFFVELDNGSERVESDQPIQSIERKIRLYEAFQDQSDDRFRVLIVTTKRPDRLEHMLNTAARLARNPARSLCYGTVLTAYLNAEYALTRPCFLNHRGEPVALISGRNSSRGIDGGIPQHGHCDTTTALAG